MALPLWIFRFAIVDVTVIDVQLKITKNIYNQHLPNTVSVRPGGCVWLLPDLRLVAIVMIFASLRMVAIVRLLQHKPIGVASAVEEPTCKQIGRTI